jgi:hypothetical protein
VGVQFVVARGQERLEGALVAFAGRDQQLMFPRRRDRHRSPTRLDGGGFEPAKRIFSADR